MAREGHHRDPVSPLGSAVEGERPWPRMATAHGPTSRGPARTHGCGQDDEGQRRSQVEGDHHRLEEAPQTEGQRTQPEESDDRRAASDRPAADQDGRDDRDHPSGSGADRGPGQRGRQGDPRCRMIEEPGVRLVEEDRRGLVPLRGQGGTEKDDRGERAVAGTVESLRLGGPDEGQGEHQDDQRLGHDGRPPQPSGQRPSTTERRQQCVEGEGQRQHVLGVTPDGDDLEDDDGLHEAEDDPTAAADPELLGHGVEGHQTRSIPAAGWPVRATTTTWAG